MADDTYLDATELQAMHQTVEVEGNLPREMAKRLIREHGRLMVLSRELIWTGMGCPQHAGYRGLTRRAPTRACAYCRALWEWHQEHDKTQRFQDVMAEQQRRVDALLAGTETPK